LKLFSYEDANELVHFETVEGELLSTLSLPSGCYYYPCYPRVTDICAATQPETQTVSNLCAVACTILKHYWLRLIFRDKRCKSAVGSLCPYPTIYHFGIKNSDKFGWPN